MQDVVTAPVELKAGAADPYWKSATADPYRSMTTSCSLYIRPGGGNILEGTEYPAQFLMTAALCSLLRRWVMCACRFESWRDGRCVPIGSGEEDEDRLCKDWRSARGENAKV
jgi:hypothetical protein